MRMPIAAALPALALVACAPTAAETAASAERAAVTEDKLATALAGLGPRSDAELSAADRHSALSDGGLSARPSSTGTAATSSTGPTPAAAANRSLTATLW